MGLISLFFFFFLPFLAGCGTAFDVSFPTSAPIDGAAFAGIA